MYDGRCQQLVELRDLQRWPWLVWLFHRERSGAMDRWIRLSLHVQDLHRNVGSTLQRPERAVLRVASLTAVYRTWTSAPAHRLHVFAPCPHGNGDSRTFKQGSVDSRVFSGFTELLQVKIQGILL